MSQIREMKKILSVLLALIIISCLAACGNNADADADTGGYAGLPSPMSDYSSLADMNGAASTDISLPEDMEVSNEAFATITSDEGVIAQYCFTYESADFTFRSSKDITDNDISGVYIEANPAFSGKVQSDIEINSDDYTMVARWEKGGCQYSLSMPFGSMTTAEFTDLVMKLN